MGSDSSIKTLLTAIIAVAGAAVMALVLAEQTTPPTLHTGPSPEAQQQMARLSCPTEDHGRDC